jgi:hypothetical protein
LSGVTIAIVVLGVAATTIIQNVTTDFYRSLVPSRSAESIGDTVPISRQEVGPEIIERIMREVSTAVEQRRRKSEEEDVHVLISRYVGHSDIELKKFERIALTGPTEADALYALYYLRTAGGEFAGNFLDLFLLRKDSEVNVLHMRGDGRGLCSLGAHFAKFGGLDYLLATCSGGSGGFMAVTVHRIESGQAKMVFSVEDLFKGEVFQAGNRWFLLGNNQKHELVLRDGSFKLERYRDRIGCRQPDGTHVVSIQADDVEMKLRFNCRQVGFLKVAEGHGRLRNSKDVLRVRMGEKILIDDNVMRYGQIRLFSGPEEVLQFRDGLFPSVVAVGQGEGEISVDYDYSDWRTIRIEVVP